MLRVKTFIMESPIPNAGIGLFANEFIPKGTIIWEYVPGLDREYTQEEFDAITGRDKEYVKKYCFKYMNKYILCLDDARFFNHSDTPNCYSSEFSETSLGYTRAIKDIFPGEELTDNYGEFGISAEDRAFNLDF